MKALLMVVTPVVDGGVLVEPAGPVVALVVVEGDVAVDAAPPEQAAATNSGSRNASQRAFVPRN
jgi:hypothetical protein